MPPIGLQSGITISFDVGWSIPYRTFFMKKYKTLLTIAGSDSIGGAGIQADIKTATALGVYVMSAVTAVTAQNSTGVKGVEAVPLQMLGLQLDSILTDFIPDAVKIGMVPTAEHAAVIADALERYSPLNIVADTVMSASSGVELSTSESITVFKQRIFPIATLITPNIPEAEILISQKIDNQEDQIRIATALLNQYRCRGVLLKGGHLSGDRMTDILAIREETGTRIIKFGHPRIATHNTHGTGCTLSSAIASFLALGYAIEDAVRLGIDYLQGAMREGALYSFGRLKGDRPVNHMYKIKLHDIVSNSL